MADYVYIGAVGLEINLTLGLTDTSIIDDIWIVAYKPDSTEVDWIADLTDGKAQYVTTTGDIDQSGNWVFQSKVTTTTGGSHLGKAFKVKIYREGQVPK